jgi:hypothetical protein
MTMMTMEKIALEPLGPMPLRGWRLREEKLRGRINEKLAEIRGLDWWDEATGEILDWMERDWNAESGLESWGDAFAAADEIMADVERTHDSQAAEWAAVASDLRQWGNTLANLGAAEKSALMERRRG